MKTSSPELGAHIFHLGITERIKTTHIRGNIILLSEKMFYPRFDFLSHIFRRIVLFNLKYPVQKIDQREIRYVLRIGIGMSFYPLNLFQIQRVLKLLNKSALSCSCITADREYPAFSLAEIFDGVNEFGDFCLPADEISP